jgi:hypothetical protein
MLTFFTSRPMRNHRFAVQVVNRCFRTVEAYRAKDPASPTTIVTIPFASHISPENLLHLCVAI